MTAEEMSEREFRMYIIKTIREANEEMKEQMQALNQSTVKRPNTGSKRSFQ